MDSFAEQAVVQPMVMASHAKEKVAFDVRHNLGAMTALPSEALPALTARHTYFWGKMILKVLQFVTRLLHLKNQLPPAIRPILDPDYDFNLKLSGAERRWIELRFAPHWPAEQWGLRSEKAAKRYAEKQHELPVINSTNADEALRILKLTKQAVWDEIPEEGRTVDAYHALLAQKLHQYRINEARRIGRASRAAWEMGFVKWLTVPTISIGGFFISLGLAQISINMNSYSPQRTDLFASLPLWFHVSGLGTMLLAVIMAYARHFRRANVPGHRSYQEKMPLAPLTRSHTARLSPDARRARDGWARMARFAREEGGQGNARGILLRGA